MTTTFHLLRHADHGHIGRVLTGRLPRIGLTEEGRGQARALAAHMARIRLDALFSSPRLRAQETAAFISAATGCDLGIAACLDEIDFGRWSGQTFEALASDPAWQLWNSSRDTAATPAGETMARVASRFAQFVEQLSARFRGGSVCLVSHGDVIKAGLCHYLGNPFSAMSEFEIGPASETVLLIGEHGANVAAVGRQRALDLQEPVA